MRSVLAARLSLLVMIMLAVGAGVGLLLAEQDRDDDDSVLAPNAATPSPIDTPDWETYTSPYGYSFQYPPDWTLEIPAAPTSNPPGVDPGESVFLMNPTFREARDASLAATDGRPGEFQPPAGAIKVDIGVASSAGVIGSVFDSQALIQLCETVGDPPEPLEGPPDVAEEIVLVGHRAVVCRGVDADFRGDPVQALVYWVELRSGLSLQIRPGMIEPTQEGVATWNAILASLSFEAPLEPSATYLPARITPGPEDTSDWETYVNPLGFTIKYPPTWLLIAPQVGGVPTGEAEILNEVRQGALHDPIGEGSQSGDAWVEIVPALSSELSLDELLEICLRPSPVADGRAPNDGRIVTLDGMPAVHCVSQGPSLTGGQLSSAEAYWIRLSTEGLLQLIAYTVDPSTETTQIVAAMFSTLSFEP